MLSLQEVTYRYPGTDATVLNEVSLDVAAGTAVGLVAPSGSGKTTLLRIAALLLPPASGTVTIDGKPISGTRFAVPPHVRRKIGIVVQSPRTSTNPRLTLRHIIAEPLSFRDGHRTPRPSAYPAQIKELTELVQLTDDLLDRLPHQVSDGQLQRACLARALAIDPSILLCDEPTAMLDAPTTAVIMRVITDRVAHGAAALIASHDRALLDAACATVTALPALLTAAP
ncbi:ATP-binding cassette domain-containing protein [Saccharomonospora sp. NPDC046836]|uniref:ABC transporter ATP-binding protein n=1 Tax=Saccharomonospora sp. NPDC046836 TaxID=3156921 RepID=UPI0034018B8F